LSGRGLKTLCALVLLSACKTATAPAGPPVDPVAFYDRLKAAHQRPATLSCDAKAFVEAPENGGRYALHIAVQRPRSIRIEALTPLGDPAAVLVAHEGKFALLDLRHNVFYRGSSTPQNLSRLLPAPLRDDELVAMLTGSFPELPAAEPISVAREGDGWHLVLSTVAPGLKTVAGYTQDLWLGDDLRVGRVRRGRADGALLREATLDEFDDASGTLLPRLLHFSVPDAKTGLDLRLKNVLAQKPPPAGAFLLGVPDGMQVEELP
jgi:hypothetical protein